MSQHLLVEVWVLLVAANDLQCAGMKCRGVVLWIGEEMAKDNELWRLEESVEGMDIGLYV